jgi:hypothetical protein
MEEEMKKAEKIVKKYNNFIFWSDIFENDKIRDMMLFLVSINFLILFVMWSRENKEQKIMGLLIISFFAAVSLFWAFFQVKNEIFLSGDSAGTYRYLLNKGKNNVREEEWEIFHLKKFTEEEGLEGMELGAEEVAKFAEWQKKRILFQLKGRT